MVVIIRTPEDEIKHLKYQIKLMKRAHKSSLEDMRTSQAFPTVLQRERNSLDYWEKQIVLYSKGHYNTGSLEHLELLVAELYHVPVETVGSYDLSHALYKIHDKLVNLKLVHFELEEFIDRVFKRSNLIGIAKREHVIKELFFAIQGTSVRVEGFNLELDEVDQAMFDRIKDMV